MKSDAARAPRGDASTHPAPAERIGLIAGNGRFPIIFSENARRLGYSVSAVAHVGETLPELEHHVDRIHWVRIGQFNKVIKALKGDGVRQAVMLGGIKKIRVFDVRPDLRAVSVARRLTSWKDDDILREIAAELEREGIAIRESTFGLGDVLAEQGVLSKRRPSDSEWEDIRYGWSIMQEVGRLDIGQCVVVKDGIVVAVEAVEGTDEAIRRGGALAGNGAVVVKRCKPQQDLRFDLPTIGPATIQTMQSVKALTLAVEASRTVVLDRHEMLRLAGEAGIAVVGVAEEDMGKAG
jgi:DUF1009 family protein